MLVSKRPLLYGSAHQLPLFTLVRDDPLIGTLVVARLESASRLPPRRHRVTAARSLAFAAAVRVVHRVHGDSAVVRHLAHPPRASCLAVGNVFVIDVADLAD